VAVLVILASAQAAAGSLTRSHHLQRQANMAETGFTLVDSATTTLWDELSAEVSQSSDEIAPVSVIL
jgi:hypothetical protein